VICDFRLELVKSEMESSKSKDPMHDRDAQTAQADVEHHVEIG
jgi:hypothetical protein